MNTMNRIGFIRRCLAACGVGAVAGAGSSTLEQAIGPEPRQPPPAPSCPRCGGTRLVSIEPRRPVYPHPEGALVTMRTCPLCRPTVDDIYTSPAA